MTALCITSLIVVSAMTLVDVLLIIGAAINKKENGAADTSAGLAVLHLPCLLLGIVTLAIVIHHLP